MDKLPEKARIGRLVVDVLVATTVWNLVLLWMNYPREDWIGVVAVGYVSVWITRAIITYPIGRVMEHLHHRIMGRVCNMYFALSKLRRQLNPEKIHRQGEYVDGLGRLAVAMGM